MSNGNSNLPQTTDELRQSVLDGVRGIYSRRYEEAQPQPEQEERPSLSSYSQDIQDLLSGNAVRDEYRNTQRQAMEKLLAANDIDPKSFFEEKPDATVVDVMRRTNFEGFADKERAYSTGHSTDYGRNRALSQIQEQFSNRFDNSLVFPDLGVKIDQYIPASIREDDRRRGDFEKAFYQETGIALDFDGSNRVGDLYVEDSGIGNAFREVGYVLDDLVTDITSSIGMGTYGAVYDLLGGDPNKKDEEFLKKQAEGEISTQLEAAEGSMSKGAQDLFWAAFTSPEARRQWVASQSSRRRIDFTAMQDRMESFNEFDTNVIIGNSVDMLVESAPLLLDLAIGSHGGSFLMKGATKAVAKQAAKKVGTRAVGKGTRFVNPKTGRFISKEAAQKVINSSNTVQRLINQGGAVAVSDLLVASQMHSDNVGQEWYDNLSGSERASYLAQQSTAEVLSGMVLNNVLGRGFFGKTPKSKVTQEGWKARKKFVTEYGKNIANSTFLGISEEALAEAGTAAWQYISEIDARIAGGDVGARFDINELDRRVKDAAAAGLMMGGLAGFAGGVIGGAARAYMASFHHSNIEGKKTIEKLAKAVTDASNATDRQKAMERLQAEVKKRSGAQSALSRAYFRMSEANPEVFEKVARIQGQINTLVHQHKSTSDPEVQGALFQEVKSLIEEKQKLENEAFEGDTTFEDVYKEEAEAVAKERGGKLKGWKGKYDSDPERLAEQAVQEGIQNQIESLEAAQAVNSPEQNADDDAQDQEGETQGESKMKRDESAPIEGVEGDGDNQLDPDALKGQPLAGKFRDLAGRANQLLKAFKGLGIDIVVHTTEQSFFNATGATGMGQFTRGRTVHINLEKAETTADTVRHEFLHAAFTTLTPQQKQQFLEELRSIRGIDARGIEKAVEKAYPDYSAEKMIEEKVVNILERTLDKSALEPSLLQRILNAFAKLLGLRENITESDLQGFVRRFRAAERSGVAFEGQQMSQAADADARDIGMRQPSRAYPDLINKKVTWTYFFVSQYGKARSIPSDGMVFKDYWHFRNWYLRETGNGKMADNIGQFRYLGDDGQYRTINPPKPKRDRETGEIIDMEPRLKSPERRQIDANEREAQRRSRKLRYAEIRKNAGNALKFAVGKIKKIEKTGELAFYNDNMLLEQDSQSELPVAYSETFFVEGLDVDQLDQLGTDFGDNLQFLIPTTTDAQLAFTVRNNGDGTVTIDAHSDAVTGFGKENGDVIAEGFAARKIDIPNTRKKEAKKRALRPRWAPAERIGNVIKDTLGMFGMSFGFDQTYEYSGIKDLFKEDGLISSHITVAKADQIKDRMEANAMAVAQAFGLEYGDVGYLAIYQTHLGPEATLGNPYVFKIILKKYVTTSEIEAALNKDTEKAKQIVKVIRNNIESAPELLPIIKDAKKGKTVRLTSEQGDKILKLLSDNLNSLSFTQRTNIAEQFTSQTSKDIILDKYNDKQFKDAEIGEVLAYTVVPFLYTPGGPDGDIQGFDIDVEEASSKRPFKGKIVAVPIKDKDGNDVPIPETMIAEERYHLAELMPGISVEISEKGDKEKTVDTSDLSVREQKTKLNPRAAISAVQGIIKPTSFYEPDNATISRYLSNQRQGRKQAADAQRTVDGMKADSRVLDLNFDNESELPFEPNRLNSFQAFMARVDQLFANKYANVFSLQRAIEGAKKAVVDISQDFINAETLMYGKTANDLEKLDEKVKVISQEMKDAGLIGEDVSQFLIARHAEERNALIAERTDGETLNGSGMSNERAQEVMNSFSPEKKAALESIAKKVDAITKDTRKTMVEFGLESQETIDAFEEMFDNYVPLGGLSVDEMSADTSLYPTGGAGMSIYGDTTRRAKGRASEANNVLAQAIAQNAAVHAKGRKNEALSSLYNLVEANPNTKVWKITNDAPFDAQSAVGVRVNGEQKFIVFTNPDHAKALKNMGVEKLDVISKAMRSFSGFLRRSFTTANPEFIISNFARDIQSALFNAMAEADIPGGQIQSKYIATKIIERVKQTLPALLKGAIGKDMDPEMAAYFEEFKEDGGQTGWGFVKDVGTIAAEIEAEVSEKNRAQKAREWMMKHSIDVVENVNDAFENSIRLAAYMEARKAGTSREKAAELAKNITVNFNRSGELGPVANAWYMFFNASVQGTVRLARSLGTLKDVRKPNGELESWHKRLNASQKMAFGLSLTTGMLTAINIAMSDEDEDGVLFYNKIPDYEKERNLIIMYDGKNYLKIPLPYGFNVFANMGSAMAEVAGGQRDITDAGLFILNSAFSSFSPISFGQSKDASKYIAKGVTPTILKPLVDIAVNESYFGSSVYKEQFPVGAPKPEAEMSFRAPEGVRSFFQWMNEATGGSEFVPGKADFNPDKFWYGFEYYIGGAGQFVTRTIGTGRDTYEMIKEGEKVPMKANDFPFLRKLYGEFSKYYDSDVYVENANLVSQLYKERKEADNKNDKRYRGIMKLESARKRTEKQIKRLRELRKEARDIENYVDRQNRIYELYEKERSLLMQFNKQFDQLRGQD